MLAEVTTDLTQMAAHCSLWLKTFLSNFLDSLHHPNAVRWSVDTGPANMRCTNCTAIPKILDRFVWIRWNSQPLDGDCMQMDLKANRCKSDKCNLSHLAQSGRSGLIRFDNFQPSKYIHTHLIQRKSIPVALKWHTKWNVNNFVCNARTNSLSINGTYSAIHIEVHRSAPFDLTLDECIWMINIDELRIGCIELIAGCSCDEKREGRIQCCNLYFFLLCSCQLFSSDKNFSQCHFA